MQFLNKLFIRMENDFDAKARYHEEYSKVVQILFKLILPYVKQVYRQSNAFSGVPDIAATFCLNANGMNGTPTFVDLFQYFTEAACCDIQ